MSNIVSATDFELAPEPTSRIFVPSPQQSTIFDWVSRGRGNAFVEAVAGAGKTTTLVQACKLMKGYVAFAAYNKKIADEIKYKVEQAGLGNVRAGTFHSFGFAAWRRAHSGVKVDARAKAEQMLIQLAVPGDLATVVTKLVSLAKQSAVGLLWNQDDRAAWFKIVDHHDLTSEMEQPDDIGKAIELAAKAVAWSRGMGGELIDFDDMIWLPVVSNVRVWQNDWVLVDEAQDTNPARRALARKMLKSSGRAMFVGDRAQAIYGFTGADSDSVDQIGTEFGCQALPLTVTYRCPKAVVAMAQTWVSHIEAHESAPQGITRHVSADDFVKVEVATLTSEDAILCRVTRPLVSLAFSLIRKGIACHVEGRDIGAGLLALARRWKVRSVNALRTNLEAYREREVGRLTAKGQELAAQAVEDKVDTLLIIMEGCQDVQCVVTKIQTMFQDTPDGKPANTLTLSTVHKAKGREWDRVYILGMSAYMPSKWARQAWQQEQERNLEYVAVTRAKAELVTTDALD